MVDVPSDDEELARFVERMRALFQKYLNRTFDVDRLWRAVGTVQRYHAAGDG